MKVGALICLNSHDAIPRKRSLPFASSFSRMSTFMPKTPVGEHNLRPVVSVVDGKAAFLKSAENKQFLKEPASLAVLVMDKLVPRELRHRLDIGVAVWGNGC